MCLWDFDGERVAGRCGECEGARVRDFDRARDALLVGVRDADVDRVTVRECDDDLEAVA